jgi:23S rRNA (uracil1939-C5)-methyltransferase
MDRGHGIRGIGPGVRGSNSPPETAEIVDTLVDGRGVARMPGKTVFVHGALKGERVIFSRRKRRRNFDEAELVEILQAAPERTTPLCESFGICGGCSLQHLDSSVQLQLKQSILIENLQRIGSVEPGRLLEPISASVWGYRRKARLAVKFVIRKERVLVGFRERNKPYVADMDRCETLHPEIGGRLAELAELIDGMSIRERVPQIEVAVGDNAVAMIFRVLSPPSEADLARLKDFGRSSGAQIYLQEKGPDSIAPLPGGVEPEGLFYELPDYGLSLHFAPTDFLQVHADVNRRMIRQAVELLRPTRESSVLDLYCGLGNFSLPFATLAGRVVGIEFAADMVARAAKNAERAGLNNVVFRQSDLSAPSEAGSPEWEGFDLVMLDPPRVGALEMMDVLARIDAERVLYVSCHPATLARDANHLVHELGYDLTAAGVMDMFPHTSHVESMALFEK